jgi:hypothetical protein
MEEVQQQVSELKDLWSAIYNTAAENPAAWQPHLPNTPLATLDETVNTVDTWLNRTRAPSGFSPGFQLAKSLAAYYLPQIIATARLIKNGQYNHLQSFVNNLINLLAAIHTMAVYSNKSESRQLNANLTAELTQALSLLNTAQQELSEKKSCLKKRAS